MGWASRLPRRRIITSEKPIVTPRQDAILRGSTTSELIAAAAAMAADGATPRPEPPVLEVVKYLDFTDKD